MKKCLSKDIIMNNGDPNIKIRFGEKEFLESVDLISKDIENKYLNEGKNIGLIGLARGGLPLLVAVSHRTGIRKINVVQIKMTESNERWDYGKPEWVNGFIDENIDEFIIFEDMVSHGRSVNLLVNELTKMNKKVLAIYTLFMNNDMKELSLDNEYMDINYVNLITQKQWVYFFWEKGYIE
ncbi:MAG: phosphoribosyltransferase [Bacilli bacterium]|nr:phosphoribosyltransferase [Bacilli bacterium]